MNKVYILWYRYDKYGDDIDSIDGIYASREAAEKKIQWVRENYPNLAEYYEIEEADLLG